MSKFAIQHAARTRLYHIYLIEKAEGREIPVFAEEKQFLLAIVINF